MLEGHHIVFGASSGVGEAIAIRLLERGCAVSAIARRAERLDALAGATSFVADLADFDAARQAVEAAVEKSGPARSFVYCAGMQLIKPVRLSKPEEVRQLVEINLTTPLLLAGLFASKKFSAPDAVFCAVSSIAATRGEAGIVAYGATKAGLDGMVRGLAREVGPRRVVGVAPGWLDTEMTQRNSHIYGDKFREDLAKASPAGPASVANVVDCVEFLLSPAAAAITGEVVRVDGGAAA
jgi:NAD(P)-dependent dehydrogenase (short-subunit alcohol dehydrogenase family)